MLLTILSSCLQLSVQTAVTAYFSFLTSNIFLSLYLCFTVSLINHLLYATISLSLTLDVAQHSPLFITTPLLTSCCFCCISTLQPLLLSVLCHWMWFITHFSISRLATHLSLLLLPFYTFFYCYPSSRTSLYCPPSFNILFLFLLLITYLSLLPCSLLPFSLLTSLYCHLSSYMLLFSLYLHSTAFLVDNLLITSCLFVFTFVILLITTHCFPLFTVNTPDCLADCMYLLFVSYILITVNSPHYMHIAFA